MLYKLLVIELRNTTLLYKLLGIECGNITILLKLLSIELTAELVVPHLIDKKVDEENAVIYSDGSVQCGDRSDWGFSDK